MILHPMLHAEILANAYHNPSNLAPELQIGHYSVKRSVMTIDRNRMSVVLYGKSGNADVVVARAKPDTKPGSSQHGVLVNRFSVDPLDTKGVAPGLYAPHQKAVPAALDGSQQPIHRNLVSDAIPDQVNEQEPSDALGITSPDSTVFDSCCVWYGIGVGNPGVLNSYEEWPTHIAYNGLRRMPFNTAGLQAVVEAGGIIPYRFELLQDRFVAFDTGYYESFITGLVKEADFVPRGPYRPVENAVIYSGSVGFTGSVSELCFDSMNWAAGDVIAIPDIVMEHKSGLEVKRYVG